MTEPQLDVLRGTLDLLILKAVAHQPLHGYAITRWVKTASQDMINVEDRALYLALHRLEAQNAIRGRWTTSPSGRRAKLYEIAAAGRKRLAADEAHWRQYVAAMGLVLAADPTGGA